MQKQSFRVNKETVHQLQGKYFVDRGCIVAVSLEMALHNLFDLFPLQVGSGECSRIKEHFPTYPDRASRYQILKWSTCACRGRDVPSEAARTGDRSELHSAHAVIVFIFRPERGLKKRPVNCAAETIMPPKPRSLRILPRAGFRQRST